MLTEGNTPHLTQKGANKDLELVENINYEELIKADDIEPMKRVLSEHDKPHSDIKREGSPYNFKDPKTKMHFIKYSNEKEL